MSYTSPREIKLGVSLAKQDIQKTAFVVSWFSCAFFFIYALPVLLKLLPTQLSFSQDSQC